MPAARGRPPKGEERLSRETVLAAGLELMQRDGLDALTMRRLATALDVRATSLYRYVRNKDELLAELADAALAGVDLESCDHPDWRTALRAMAHRLRAHLLARRDAARLIGGRFTTGPHGLRVLDTLLRPLRAAGLSDRDTAYALYLGGVAIFGFVAAEQTPVSAEVAAGMPPRRYLEELGTRLAALPAADYPNVVALAADLTGPDLNTRFEFMLDRLVAGLESGR